MGSNRSVILPKSEDNLGQEIDNIVHNARPKNASLCQPLRFISFREGVKNLADYSMGS